jgi:hypothetical protein
MRPPVREAAELFPGGSAVVGAEHGGGRDAAVEDVGLAGGARLDEPETLDNGVGAHEPWGVGFTSHDGVVLETRAGGAVEPVLAHVFGEAHLGAEPGVVVDGVEAAGAGIVGDVVDILATHHRSLEGPVVARARTRHRECALLRTEREENIACGHL